MMATHKGTFAALPTGLNEIYYTPSASVTLLSLGAQVRKYGSYTGDITGLRVYSFLP